MTALARLLAAIHEDPSDDDARMVYADALHALGDPHGELIAMQLARAGRPPTEIERKRELALLRRHWRKFVGPLAEATNSLTYSLEVGPLDDAAACPRFERGFLVAFDAGHAKPDSIEAAIDAPALATVELLMLADAEAMPLLDSTTLTALRVLSIPAECVDVALASPIIAQLDTLEVRAKVRRPMGGLLGRISIVRTLSTLVPGLFETGQHALRAAMAANTLKHVRVRIGDKTFTLDREKLASDRETAPESES